MIDFLLLVKEKRRPGLSRTAFCAIMDHISGGVQMKIKRLSRLMALFLTAATLTAPAAQALTTEQAAELLGTLYIDQIPQEALEKSTVKEMVDALGDPYTEYFTPEEYAAFVASMSDSSLVGIGVVFTNTAQAVPEEGLLIEQVLDGSPAAQGGLLAGDMIQAVDGKPVQGSTLDLITEWIRGEINSTVDITYVRDGVQSTVTLTRDTVVVAATTTELIDGHIGYIRCTTFGEETAGHFRDGIEQYGDQVDVWVVDLRSNLGGATQAATDAAGFFTGSGYMSILRDGTDAYSAYYCEEEPLDISPVIVLVDQYSASSSEIFASAIQSHGAGIVIGDRTFGKGVAQIVCDQSYLPDYFPDGDAIKITAYRFFSPAGNTTDQIGVMPELLVDPVYAGDIAYLIDSKPIPGHKTLRLDMTWRWFVDLDTAVTEENREAFQLLLDAIPQGTPLWRETEDLSVWEPVELSQICEEFGFEYRPAQFPDQELSNYPDILSILKTYDIIHGHEDGSFRPKDSMTRAEFCQLLYEALNCKRTDNESPYSDVPADAWYATAVTALTDMGLVSGIGNGLFDPEASITHQELFTVMGGLASFLNMGFYNTAIQIPEDALTSEALAAYEDWARPFVWLLSESQTSLLGQPLSLLWAETTDIDPTAPTTREEAAWLLYTLLSYTEILPA